MNAQELAKKAQELKELKTMQQELAEEITALEDAFKKELTEQDTETIRAGAFTIRWTTYNSSKFDAKALRAELPEIAARYTTETQSRRFSIG